MIRLVNVDRRDFPDFTERDLTLESILEEIEMLQISYLRDTKAVINLRNLVLADSILFNLI